MLRYLTETGRKAPGILAEDPENRHPYRQIEAGRMKNEGIFHSMPQKAH
jgi:hypothetical protein